MRVEQVLKDEDHGVYNKEGNFVRKGTVYTMLLNAQQYQNLIHSNDNSGLETLLEDIKVNTEEVGKTGLFNFFSIHEWLQDSQQEGRIMTALIYCQNHPELVDYPIRQQLQKLKEIVSPVTSDQIKKVLGNID